AAGGAVEDVLAREDDEQRAGVPRFGGDDPRRVDVHPARRLRLTFAALHPGIRGREQDHVGLRLTDRPAHGGMVGDVQPDAGAWIVTVHRRGGLHADQRMAQVPADESAGSDQQNARGIRHGQWRAMGRIAWRTSLLPLLLPLISTTAAIVLAPRWKVLDPVDASIIEHWLPFAAALAAGVTVA